MEVTMLECEGMIRLPEKICRAARLKDGTLLEATIASEGILLRTLRPTDTEQPWIGARKRLDKLKATAAKEQAVSGHADVYEITWADDGRATYSSGKPVRPGHMHIKWRRIGTHAIFDEP